MNDGGPAFPTSQYTKGGLSKRDWFAGMAMEGMLSGTTTELGNNELACISCRMADALLAELDKQQ